MKTLRLLYAYTPTAAMNSRAVLAVPPTSGHQRATLVDPGSQIPVAILSEESNQLELYDLKPGDQILREYAITIDERPQPTSSMSRHLVLHYLRESTIIDFGHLVLQVAHESKRATSHETARAVFDKIVSRSSYHWPPERRGASSFLEHWRGDCGQMSFAMAAVLRNLIIPARVAVGAFAQPGLKAHAWLEFFDGSAWIVTDPALGNAKPHEAERWFDFAPVDRVVFSYDCDLALESSVRHPRGMTNVDIAIGDELLNWGGRLLKGAIPYLQPGYPLIDERMTRPLTLPVWDISVASQKANTPS